MGVYLRFLMVQKGDFCDFICVCQKKILPLQPQRFGEPIRF